ncbi:LppX_LprAFG lipoprotein [Amycolatopsis cihanbeyliensis]|uniref:Lipoprotein LprG n=1 Tax=Amycolatopsis cihanbeyliensis TaxID=1128664 RepID=A0A542DPK0_AMYCI|nr:LppX_LprAFG lipoprotein [Amycolatopsis cihanbeyliensis]TQJ04976.1 lipoprotein LprG [Amycolatopsis cihanbeyliensis]
MLCRRTALVTALALGLLAGCASSPDTTGPLPEGRGLVAAAADRLAELRSVRFTLGVSGTVPGMNIRNLEGAASTEGGEFGWASGTADVQDGLERVEYEFLLQGDTLYLTGNEGSRWEEPVPARYAPATVLAPETGLRQLLTSARELETEGREELEEVEAFRVNGAVSREVVSELVPGIQSDVDLKFWVTAEQPRDLVRVWMQIPPRKPNEGAVMLELALTEHNLPVRP